MNLDFTVPVPVIQILNLIKKKLIDPIVEPHIERSHEAWLENRHFTMIAKTEDIEIKCLFETLFSASESHPYSRVAVVNISKHYLEEVNITITAKSPYGRSFLQEIQVKKLEKNTWRDFDLKEIPRKFVIPWENNTVACSFNNFCIKIDTIRYQNEELRQLTNQVFKPYFISFSECLRYEDWAVYKDCYKNVYILRKAEGRLADKIDSQLRLEGYWNLPVLNTLISQILRSPIILRTVFWTLLITGIVFKIEDNGTFCFNQKAITKIKFYSLSLLLTIFWLALAAIPAI